MWLFDDLLKKPTPPSDDTSTGQWSTGTTGTQGTQTNDPLAAISPVIKIEKTTESSIVTESPVMTTSKEPDPVNITASDDTSSILITSESAPVIATVEETLSPVITNEVNPTLTIETSPTPTETPTVPETPVDLSNLFGISASSTTPDEAHIVGNSDSQTTEWIEQWMENPIFAENIESTVDTPPLMEFTQSTDTDYEHPSDFITASIEKIDTMVEKIEEAHEAKLQEALGYKSEKEKFTKLEEEAYADATALVEEKEHALSMREYFVQQGSGTTGTTSSGNTPADSTENPLFAQTGEINNMEEEVPEAITPVSSIETTLTGLAVANAVTETVAPTPSNTLMTAKEEITISGSNTK